MVASFPYKLRPAEQPHLRRRGLDLSPVLRPLFTHTNTVQYKYKHFLPTQIQNWSPRVLAADSHGETKLPFMQCEKKTPSQMDVEGGWLVGLDNSGWVGIEHLRVLIRQKGQNSIFTWKCPNLKEFNSFINRHSSAKSKVVLKTNLTFVSCPSVRETFQGGRVVSPAFCSFCSKPKSLQPPKNLVYIADDNKNNQRGGFRNDTLLSFPYIQGQGVFSCPGSSIPDHGQSLTQSVSAT